MARDLAMLAKGEEGSFTACQSRASLLSAEIQLTGFIPVASIRLLMDIRSETWQQAKTRIALFSASCNSLCAADKGSALVIRIGPNMAAP